MDFLLTSILVFGTGLLVGRLFYKLNPFFMLFGLVLGGAMFVMAMELNIFYCIIMIGGVFYGLTIMRSRNPSASRMGDADSSLFGKIIEFFYLKFLLSDAEKFRQEQAQEDSAYDEYKRYEQRAYQDKQQAEEQAEQKTQQAHAESEKARQQQDDVHNQWKKYEQEKQKYEQEKQESQEEEFVDGRSSYEILGVKETASLDEIKKAYRKLRAKLHADKNQNRSPAFIKEAESELVKVIHAYESLTGKKA